MIGFRLIVFISVYFKQFFFCILSARFFSYSKLVCNCFICNSLSGALSIFVFVIVLNALMTSLDVCFSWWRFFSFVSVCSDSLLVSSFFIFFVSIFQFLEFCCCCFIFTFPDSLFLVDLVLFSDTLHFFWVLLHYFLFCCSFTFEMGPSLTIFTLNPCSDVFVTRHAVFTFYDLLLFLDMVFFYFIFLIVWLFSSINLYTSVTILWFFCFFLSLFIPYQCFFL